MSSEPITPDTPPTTPAPVADYVAANRSPVAIALIAVGVICLGVGGYFLVRGFSSPRAERKADDPDDPVTAVTIADPNRPAHLAAGILGLLGAAAGIGAGGWLLGRTPRADSAGRRAEARAVILLAGGMFGFVLMLGGLWFFYLWFGSLTAWLDQGRRAEARWVLGPLLVFVLGAGLAFAATQPARGEERNSPLLRRLVYGANLGLTALLLLLVLTAGNVFAALRVPNQLDTTETGFYTLDDSTRRVIAGLEQPVTAYSTLFEVRDEEVSRLIRDTRSLLTAAQEVNPARFRVRFLSPTLDRTEIDRLSAKFPQFDRQDMGILLAVGDDEARASFLRVSDLFTREFEGRTPRTVFQGEAKLVRELLFLSEGRDRPVVYFTQGQGELEIASPPPDADARPAGVRTANRIRDALEQNYVDVRPLEFDLASPKVPDDAAVVVVADPRTPFPPERAEAIRRYMADPRPDGRRGKLVVLTSPHPRQPERTGVAETGLEGVLADLGVRLGTEYLYSQRANVASYHEATVAVTGAAEDDRNPMALAFSDRLLVLPNCRQVLPSGQPGGPYRVTPLFVTYPPNRPTWLEPDPLPNPAQRWQQFVESEDLRVARQLTTRPRSVAVLVSEQPALGAHDRNAAPTARAAVYGSGQFFADPDRRARVDPTPVELIVATLDWLRDRPVVTIAGKDYRQYTMKPEADAARILYLPVGITLLGILAVGFGMWVFRQK